AVIWRGIREWDDLAAGDVRQRHRDRVDLGAVEILDPLAAGAVGPLVRGMLVGPGRAPAMRAHDPEDGVHAQILMRQDGAATVLWVAHEEMGIEASAPVQAREIDVHRLVPRDVGADLA